jgi:serine protease Do
MMLSISITTASAHDLDQPTAVEVLKATVRVNRSGGQGSGVIIWSGIDEDDERIRNTYVLTNQHVVERSQEVEVTTFIYLKRRNSVGTTTFQSRVVLTSRESDLALIEIQTPPEVRFTLAPLISEEDWDEMELYEEIYLSGCGNGANPHITHGNLSAVNRAETRMEFTAHVIWGSSGGGLFNNSGELVGICNAMRLSRGHPVTHQGFGIPISQIRKILRETDYSFVLGEEEEEEEDLEEDWEYEWEDDSDVPDPETPDKENSPPAEPLRRKYF